MDLVRTRASRPKRTRVGVRSIHRVGRFEFELKRSVDLEIDTRITNIAILVSLVNISLDVKGFFGSGAVNVTDRCRRQRRRSRRFRIDARYV